MRIRTEYLPNWTMKSKQKKTCNVSKLQNIYVNVLINLFHINDMYEPCLDISLVACMSCLLFLIFLSPPPQVSIEDMEKEKLTLQSDAENYSDQVTDLTCVWLYLFYTWSISVFLWIKPFTLCLGPTITTETPDYDRNVPGEWAQTTQVYAYAVNGFIWTNLSVTIRWC